MHWAKLDLELKGLDKVTFNEYVQVIPDVIGTPCDISNIFAQAFPKLNGLKCLISHIDSILLLYFI